jgi:hypothetical protein
MADSRTTLSLLAQAFPGLTLQDTQQTSDENTSNTLSLFAEAFPGLTLGDTEQATDAVQVTNFPEFADLPSEIRIVIWKEACPKGRTIQIELKGGYVKYSPTPAPVILHVNQESRYEALKVYHALKPDHCRHDKIPSPIYFHPETDAIYFHSKPANRFAFLEGPAQPFFNDEGMRAALSKVQLLKVKKITMSWDVIHFILMFPTYYPKNGIASLQPFRGLKKLLIVIAKIPSYLRPQPQDLSRLDQSVFLRTLFEEFAPMVYDATKNPSLAVLNHSEHQISEFWDESFDRTLSENEEVATAD